MFLTLGSRNIVVFAPEQATGSMEAWLKDHPSIDCERWNSDGELLALARKPSVRTRAATKPGPTARNWLEDVESIAKLDRPEGLRPALEEYLLLAKACMMRFEKHQPALARYVTEANRSVYEMLTWQPQQSADEDEPRPILGSDRAVLVNLVGINSGLSHLLNQSCTPDILLPCQVPPIEHSLLGIATANVAFWKVYKTIWHHLGKLRLNQRFAGLMNQPANEAWRFGSTEWLDKDPLRDVELTEAQLRTPLFSHLVYLNEPEHFQYTTTTLSLPTSVLSACNTPQWSLLPVTHELSHPIIRGVLETLLPTDPDRMYSALTDTDRRTSDRRWIDVVRPHLYSTVVAMSRPVSEHGRYDSFDGTVHREKLLAAWKKVAHEAEEIMVHTFDYLYFYQSREDKYIESIWQSLSVIPNFEARLSQFLVRIGCAVSSQTLGPNLAISKVEDCLKRLSRKKASGADFADLALREIESHRDELQLRILLFRPLVIIVRTMLYSERLASSLSRETGDYGGFQALELGREDARHSNPFFWIETFTGQGADQSPSPAKSAWMIQMLAFHSEADVPLISDRLSAGKQ